MLLRQMTIRARLIAGYIFSLLLLSAIAAVGFISSANVKNQLDSLVQSNSQEIDTSRTLRATMTRQAISVRNFGITGTDLAKETKETQAAQKAFHDTYAKLESRFQALGETRKAELQSLAEIRSQWNQLEPQVNALVELSKTATSGEVGAFIREKISPIDEPMQAKAAKFIKAQQARNSVEIEQTEATYERDKVIVLVLVAASLVAGAVVAWLSARSITVPLNEVVGVANRIAAGDLNATLKVSGRDELTRLQTAMHSMTVNLRTIVSSVRESSSTITQVSNEIAGGNADLAARTEAQAASLEETASSMTELATTVKLNAENANHADSTAKAASRIATTSQNAVADVVSAMAKVELSSRKISDITAVIDGIAFQTNILSLNAAVEAARAGEQGRGFAVVAKEVRDLAQKSSQASKEIAALIQQNMTDANDGVDAVKTVEGAICQVVHEIDKVSSLVSEIAAASKEQSEGLEQVNMAISSLDHTTQQNAALVEQAAASSESMRAQAQELSQAVDRFKVDAFAA